MAAHAGTATGLAAGLGVGEGLASGVGVGVSNGLGEGLAIADGDGLWCAAALEFGTTGDGKHSQYSRQAGPHGDLKRRTPRGRYGGRCHAHHNKARRLPALMSGGFTK